ncbi:hypothetical protein ACLB2K_022164 [Fragaria x ananassa]
MAWLEECHKAQVKITKTKQSNIKKWKPPATGKWKMNIDSSFISSIWHGGTGGILRDDQGNFKAAFAIPVSTVASAKQVELCAIKERLKLVRTLNLNNGMIETDCLEAVACISDVQGSYVGLEGILHDIRDAMSSM